MSGIFFTYEFNSNLIKINITSIKNEILFWAKVFHSTYVRAFSMPIAHFNCVLLKAGRESKLIMQSVPTDVKYHCTIFNRYNIIIALLWIMLLIFAQKRFSFQCPIFQNGLEQFMSLFNFRQLRIKRKGELICYPLLLLFFPPLFFARRLSTAYIKL